MAALTAAGMTSQDHLLDIGCGALRLGHLAVPYLEPGHYWGTDASLDLMRHGRAVELDDPDRLPLSHLVQDADFAFPGIPDDINYAIAWGVFTHLPTTAIETALPSIALCLPRLKVFLFTVFLVPDSSFSGAYRQTDGVVTHPDRAPRHIRSADVSRLCAIAGMCVEQSPDRLPRGQVLFQARRDT